MIRVDVSTGYAILATSRLASDVVNWLRTFQRGAVHAREVEREWWADNAAGGKKWPSLAESTMEARGLEGEYSGYYKRERPRFNAGPSNPILGWTGRLGASFFLRKADGHVERQSGRKMDVFEFGSDYKYRGIPLPRIHHGGLGKVPQRLLLDREGLVGAFLKGSREQVADAARRFRAAPGGVTP